MRLDYSEGEFNEILVVEFNLIKNDLVVGATDGLWDNRGPEELEKYVDFDDSTENIINQLAVIPHDRKDYQDDRGIIVYRYV